MARKIKSLDDAPVDVVEAVKRSFIHRGFIPSMSRRSSRLDDNEPSSKDADADNENSKSDEKKQNNRADTKAGSKKQNAGQTDPKESKTRDHNQEGDMDDENDDSGKTIIEKKAEQKHPYETGEVESQEIHEKLIDITEKAQDILFTADTVFPFTLFPDTITLDREKLTIVKRFFFRVAKVITVPITSMISADCNVGPFFGSVHMTSKYFIDSTHTVRFLWRHDAEEIHRLIQGFIIAQEKGLDVSDIDKEDLKILIEDLGQGTKQ